MTSIQEWPSRKLELRPPLMLAMALSTLESTELDRLQRAVSAEHLRRMRTQPLKPQSVFGRMAKGALVMLLMFTPMLTGCVLDINKLATEFLKPKVSFATPQAWRCDTDAQQIPTAKGLEPCTMCLNTKGPQLVTIADIEHTVPRGGQVAICQTVAFTIEP